jgi:hypothetical protein
MLLSASIAHYRHQAKMFYGESDGKIGMARKGLNVFQVITSAGDN